MQVAQCKGRWPPIVECSISACSRTRLLTHRPVWPMYTRPQLKGIRYTTPTAQSTYLIIPVFHKTLVTLAPSVSHSRAKLQQLTISFSKYCKALTLDEHSQSISFFQMPNECLCTIPLLGSTFPLGMRRRCGEAGRAGSL